MEANSGADSVGTLDDEFGGMSSYFLTPASC
jgi:hypothetical protein